MKKKRIQTGQLTISLMLAMYDLIAIHVAYFFALWARFDFVYSSIPVHYFNIYRSFISFYAVGCLGLFWIFRLYQSMWSYASFVELTRIMEASLIASITLNEIFEVCRAIWYDITFSAASIR